jgi:integrase
MKLTATRIRNLSNTPGLYGDGNNLWLRVTDTGSQSWMFRYMLHGKAHNMGLGSLNLVPLGEARQKAAEARKLLHAGRDPLDQREQARAVAVIKARAPTFAYAAECYFTANQAGWTPLYRQKWRRALRDYALPVIGDLPVEAVDTDLIRRILAPIWDCKTATATVLRGRLEAVLSYATTLGWRSGPNPAVWRGHLKNILSRPSKVSTTVHYPALDWREAPAFMRRLREETSVASYAIQFGILTAARSGEVLGATWKEFDFDTAMWTIPAERMKARIEHRVPLSKPAWQCCSRWRRCAATVV